MEDRLRGDAADVRAFALSWLPVLGWAGLIFALSAQPGLRVAPDQEMDLVLRKLGHMAVFGILALLLWRAIASTTAGHRRLALALALTFAYAVTDELHQAFVATRHPSPIDVAIDAAGALVALAALAVVRSRRSERRRRA
jgi:VanZ family protein